MEFSWNEAYKAWAIEEKILFLTKAWNHYAIEIIVNCDYELILHNFLTTLKGIKRNQIE